MRESNPNFPRNKTLPIGSHPSLSGLGDFLKDLERIFFAEASVTCWPGENGREDLVLHLNSPLLLLEVLHHHRRGHWGTAPGSRSTTSRTRLEELLQALEQSNNSTVDIEELSLELSDILLVIRKSGPGSIPREFDRLLETLGAHYVYLTNGLQQMPYEIYIPALEEGDPPRSDAPEAQVSDFYGYWAAYFETEIDARIYDLDARQCLAGAKLHYGSPPVY